MPFGLNAEIFRRAEELRRINRAEAGGTLRIGGGWRSDAFATSEFYRRYTRTTQTRRVKATDKWWDGAWWSLNAGEIGVATPGSSYHTTMPPDALTGDTGAVAIDWVNEIAWMNANCHRVGFKSFQHIPGEAHHTQPLEYPSNRRDFRPTDHKLTVWSLPGDDDMMKLIRPQDCTAVLRLGLDGTVTWVKDGDVLGDVIAQGLVDPEIKVVSVRSLSVWVGKGPFPEHRPWGTATLQLSRAMFAGWED